jgi:hypothetical protein
LYVPLRTLTSFTTMSILLYYLPFAAISLLSAPAGHSPQPPATSSRPSQFPSTVEVL